MGVIDRVVSGFFIFLMIFIMFEGLFLLNSANPDDVQKKAESGSYVCYYNGAEIDPKTIDISLYEYTVNDEKRTIYLTDKQGGQSTNSTMMIPVVIPIH